MVIKWVYTHSRLVSVNLFFMMSYSSCELFFRLDWVLNCFSAAQNPCFQPSLVALLTFSYSDGSLNLILLPIFASSPKMATHRHHASKGIAQLAERRDVAG